MSDKTFREQLEEANDVEEVRWRLASGLYSGRHKSEAEEFVRSEDAEREQAAKDRSEAREEEALCVAREANSISRNARTWSIIAIVVSVLTALVVAFVRLVYNKN